MRGGGGGVVVAVAAVLVVGMAIAAAASWSPLPLPSFMYFLVAKGLTLALDGGEQSCSHLFTFPLVKMPLR
jgi:hypothetical protein